MITKDHSLATVYRFVQYRSTRKSVFSVKYQVIWCPKYRRDVFRGPIQTRLKQIIAEVSPSVAELMSCRNDARGLAALPR
ncbi:transposase IS200 like family protein [Mycobacterium kansasii 662]|uniref:Transposase IS200 like family protein n=1 Tax=Mycobacterium kansasii 662 TaxID=1299326 RepID=X7YRT7_MYCKA|nr:transposase IS200 like family protein [Mycobacterium kansasii 662]